MRASSDSCRDTWPPRRVVRRFAGRTWLYVLVWALVSLAVAAASVSLYVVYLEREVDRERALLEAAAEHAAVLIESELARMEENAVAYMEHRGFALRVAKYLAGDASIGPFLEDRIETEVRARGYVCVLLIGPDGTPLYEAGRVTWCPDTAVELARAALEQRDIAWSDMLLEEDALRSLRMAIPLMTGPGVSPVAAMVISADLTEPIDAALAIPSQWRSLESTLAAASAALGTSPERIEAYAPIEDSPWMVIASVDRSEVVTSTAPIAVSWGLGVLALSAVAALGLVIAHGVATQRDEERQAKLALQARIETAERFIADMSHELRSPLNSIIGFAHMLESGAAGPVNAEQRTQLGLVVRAGKRMAALVNDLLDLSKARAGMTVPKPSTFSAGDLLAGVHAIASVQAEQKGVRCSVAPLPDEIRMCTDRGLIERVLLNVVGNAIKFTPQGGSVTIAASLPESGVVAFTVADTGYGIAQEEMGRVMEEFFQGTSVPEEVRAVGTGLGLPISKRLVSILGGTLGFTSVLGEGSTFEIRIPRVLPHAGALGGPTR